MPSLEQVRRKLEGRRRDDLVLLVGRNPIPNFVAASLLQPKTVYMVFTEDTKDVKERLVETLRTHVSWDRGVPNFIDRELVNECDVDEVQRVVKELVPVGSGLHYTGGMKTMAAHVYYFWRQSGGDLRFASYLNESSGTLWFDDGMSESIDGAAPLSLKALSELHGLSELNARSLPEESSLKGCPSAGDAVTITREAAKDPEKISELTKSLSNCIDGGCTMFSRLSYSSDSSPPRAKNQAARSEWSGFIEHNQWLEVFTAHCVAEAGKQIEEERFEHGETHWDVRAKTVAGRDFQVDVVHCRGHRLYALSCTTAKPSKNLDTVKNKLFEVSLRSRQLGGDFARSAVVSFLDGSRLSELQNDVEAAYGPIDEKGNRRVAHVPKVFGGDHIRAWLNDDLSSLKEWLRV